MLLENLSYLESTGFVHLAQVQPDLEYEFKHTLMQEAVYQTLLKREKTQLHRLVGEVLESYYQDGLGAVSPMLAEHFYLAGDKNRALKYSLLAGETAKNRYAIPEAIDHFSRSIEIARDLSKNLGSLFLERGHLYESMGNYDRARQDLEASVNEAQLEGNKRLEIQALLTLGFTWAAQDYERTGEYCHRALELARDLDDPVELAHTLNRVGNYSLNSMLIDEAIENHKEALRIFESEKDLNGIASTVDLLAMATGIKGDFYTGQSYQQRAKEIYSELDDRQGLAHNAIFYAFGCSIYQSDVMVPVIETLEEGINSIQVGLDIAISIHWRSAEAFAHAVFAQCYATKAQFDLAIEHACRALDIANRIEHLQWTTAANYALGNIFLDLFSYQRALRHLESGLELARQIHSVFWEKVTIPSLAQAYIKLHQFERAEKLLTTAIPEDTSASTLIPRMVWTARADQAFAKHDVKTAFEIIDRVNTETPFTFPGRVPLRIALKRGEFLAFQERYAEAEVELQAGRIFAERHGAYSYLWRFTIALARVYHAKNQVQEALKMSESAKKQIQTIASKLPEQDLQTMFIENAMQALFLG